MTRSTRSPLRYAALLALALPLSLVSAQRAPEAPASTVTKRPMTIDDIMSIRNVGSPQISPNGAWVVYTVNAWEHPNATPAKGDTALGDKHEMRSHLWLVPSDGSRPARQITYSERGESQPRWSPDGTRISFLSARANGGSAGGGSAAAGDDAPRAQLHVLRVDGGEAERMTDIKDGVNGYAWSPDGKKIALLSTDSMSKEEAAARKRRDDPQVFEGDFRLSHVFVLDVASRTVTELAHSARYTVRSAPEWAPDSRRFTYLTAPTPLGRDERRAAYIADVDGGAPQQIVVDVNVQDTPVWSPDGKTLAFATLKQTEGPPADSMPFRTIGNEHLVLYDVASKRARDVSGSYDNSPGALTWSRDGKALLFSAGDRAYASIVRFDVASGAYTKLVSQKLVRSLSMDDAGTRAAMIVDSPTAPGEIYVSDATFAAPRKLTETNPQLASVAIGETEVVTWKSSDGMEVEGILLKPVGYRAGERYPLLVDIHGGPTGAHSSAFKANWGSPGQYWAGQGWAVLYPNPRGSTNYGEKFMRGNIPDWGGGDYRDIMTGVDAMVARGIADESKLAVTGWSYGGYMTSWVVTQTHRFKAAMEGAGLTDLVSMYGTTDIPGYISSFFKGMPNKETTDFYRARSAMTFVDNVTTPLLILHGGNDQRVPIGQPMQYYRALRDRGKTVELVFYPREGHGLSEYYHQRDKIRRQYDWIAKYTLGTKSLSSR